MNLLRPLIFATLSHLASAEIIVREGLQFFDNELVVANQESTTLEDLTPDPAGDDLALFTNGDLMHGTFGGISEGMVWNRADIERPIKFKLGGVRQVAFTTSKFLDFSKQTSFVTLINGDRLPGEILSLDDQALTLQSSIIGEVAIPRAHIESLTPNPFDGELFYSGPYTSQGWMILDYRKTEEELRAEEEAAEKKEAEAQADAAEPKSEDEQKADKEKPSAWVHSGDAFYSRRDAPLVFPNAGLPDVGRIQFKARWKGRLNLTLALLSDFTRVLPPQEKKDAEADPDVEGEPAEPEEEAPLRLEKLESLRKGKAFQSVPWLSTSQRSHSDIFGSGYTVTFYYSSPTLQRNSFDDNGKAVSSRLARLRTNVSFTEKTEAEIEVRYNRKKGVVILFVDGDYVGQWNDLGGFPSSGNGLGFLSNDARTRLKISDVLVTSWNGLTDSARSMIHPERDLALLTNGTDRFSGQISEIKDGLVQLTSPFIDTKIPISEISKIMLGQAGQTDLDDLADDLDGFTTVVFRPFGRLRLQTESATPESLSGTSPFLGQIKVDLSAAALLQFTDTPPDLADWFNDL